MMQRKNIFTYIIILAISLLMLPTEVQAQKHKQPHVEEPDSTPLFNGVAVSVDLAGPIQRMISDYGQYEAAVRLNLKDRYFPIVEVGIGDADYTDDVTGINYKTKAPYGRLGLDFNILKNKHDKYRLYIGGRYGFTSFKYDLSSPGVSDPIYGGEATWGVKDAKGSQHWYEAVVGVDASIIGWLHLGWSVRYRGRITQKSDDIGQAWYIPGYGKSDTSRIGVTFNIILDI